MVKINLILQAKKEPKKNLSIQFGFIIYWLYQQQMILYPPQPFSEH